MTANGQFSLSKEFDACQTGVLTYDELMFRVRSWHIAVMALLLGAYLGANSAKEVEPAVAAVGLTLIGLAFWIVDAFNKSLQMIYIENLRALERCALAGGENYRGPTISLRFAQHENKRLRHTIKNMSHEAVWIFHALPITISSAVILVDNSMSDSRRGHGHVQVQQDAAVLAIFYGSVLLIVATSMYIDLFWEDPKPTGEWLRGRMRKARNDALEISPGGTGRSNTS